MDHTRLAPLTAEQAKRRLLEAAVHCSPSFWLRAHPWGGVAIGFFSGAILGSGRRRRDYLVSFIVSELGYYLHRALARR